MKTTLNYFVEEYMPWVCVTPGHGANCHQSMKASLLTTLLLVVVTSLMCAACTKTYPSDATLLQSSVQLNTPNVPNTPTMVLDKNSDYAKAWPDKPGLFKLNDNLILQIPPQFHKFWEQRDWMGRSLVPRPPLAIDKIPEVDTIGFQMFMPDFSGYTPENYKREFSPDIVEILQIQPAPLSYAEPDAPGSHPPNQFKRTSAQPSIMFDLTKFKDEFGLRCYERNDPDFPLSYCYGKRDESLGEFILLNVMDPPYNDYIVNPQIQTKYFTKQYGGMEIVWRTSMKNLPRWHEIDQQIWKYIDTWNIAPEIATSTNSVMTH